MADSSIIKCGVSAVMHAARQECVRACVEVCEEARLVGSGVSRPVGADKDKAVSGPCL